MSAEHSRVAARASVVIERAYEAYLREFREITRRAAERHERREWQEIQQDARDRLDLHGRFVTSAITELRDELGVRAAGRPVWAAAKRVYLEAVGARADHELAQTFFNSVTRRLFSTVGVDPAVEFVDAEYDRPRSLAAKPAFTSYAAQRSTAALVASLFGNRRVANQPIVFDAAVIADTIDRHRADAWGAQPCEGVDLLDPVFYRNKGAYLIGRIRGGGRLLPLVIALVSDGDRLVVDASSSPRTRRASSSASPAPTSTSTWRRPTTPSASSSRSCRPSAWPSSISPWATTATARRSSFGT